MASKDTESENPFGEYEPSPLTGRWTLPHSGNHERALLGYLCCCLVEDVLQIAELLHPMDIHTPLHRALYKSIVRHARVGRVIIEAACDGIDRWLVTDVGCVVPARYLGACMEFKCADEHEVNACISWIRECAQRRKIFDSGNSLKQLALNTDLSLEDVYKRANRIHENL